MDGLYARRCGLGRNQAASVTREAVTQTTFSTVRTVAKRRSLRPVLAGTCKVIQENSLITNVSGGAAFSCSVKVLITRGPSGWLGSRGVRVSPSSRSSGTRKLDWEGKMPIQGKAAIRIEGGGRKSGYPDGAKSKERRGRWATGTWLVGDRGEVIRIEGFPGR